MTLLIELYFSIFCHLVYRFWSGVNSDNPLLLLGLALQMEWSLDLLKVLMILAFILATNPTASHSMAKAALHGGRRPLVAGSKDAVAQGDGSSKI